MDEQQSLTARDRHRPGSTNSRLKPPTNVSSKQSRLRRDRSPMDQLATVKEVAPGVPKINKNTEKLLENRQKRMQESVINPNARSQQANEQQEPLVKKTDKYLV